MCLNGKEEMFISLFLSQRGVLNRDSHQLILHPLPNRFGPTTHIIYKTHLTPAQNSTASRKVMTNDGFEPKRSIFEPQTTASNGNDDDGENLYSRRRTKRRIQSSHVDRIPQNLFVETAIFVDRDLFRHMAKNYPQNTEGNLIRFVLSMINGVSLNFG